MQYALSDTIYELRLKIAQVQEKNKLWTEFIGNETFNQIINKIMYL